MKNFDLVLNIYIGLVALAIGFSASQYIETGSFSIWLFVTLIGAGLAIFGRSK